MIGFFERLTRPLLHALDPEDAHALAISMLKFAPLPPAARGDKRLTVRAFGLNFPNPVGMAAGFDKNAEVPDALLRLGFGFVEVGTITPLPQAGNPRPRLFRLDADEGVINRLGFNSQGADAVLKRLAARARAPARGAGGAEGIVGINVGANKDAFDRVADYVRLIERFAAVASYVTINISSPNTPGQRVAQHAGPTPVLLKIATDLSLDVLDDVVNIARSRRVDGMIVGNTTLARPATLRDAVTAHEAGGLSGRPLLPLATRILAETYVRVEGVFPLVGVGGIDSGAAALAKFRAGASLVQLYSGLVFRGLSLVAEIKAALIAALARARLDSLGELVGADAAAVTSEPWPV